VESGGNLRAAVFGVNDGLISNASLIMGVAGASADSGIVLLTGAAGLVAGAFSMAAGEYVSVHLCDRQDARRFARVKTLRSCRGCAACCTTASA